MQENKIPIYILYKTEFYSLSFIFLKILYFNSVLFLGITKIRISWDAS